MSEPITILALDMATKTGWAVSDPEGATSGVQVFDVRRGESPGMRWLRFDAWLEQVHILATARHPMGVLVYELAHHRGGASTAVGVGFATKAQEFAARHNIELMPVHTATLKKFATGSGKADKDAMIAAARARGWTPQDDNEADALWLLEYAKRELAITEPEQS
jgi:Holliday junction resolvasome RuvABC endonuclease subunit